MTASLPAPNNRDPQESDSPLSAPIVQLTSATGRTKKSKTRPDRESAPAAAAFSGASDAAPASESTERSALIIPPKPPLPEWAERPSEASASADNPHVVIATADEPAVTDAPDAVTDAPDAVIDAPDAVTDEPDAVTDAPDAVTDASTTVEDDFVAADVTASAQDTLTVDDSAETSDDELVSAATGGDLTLDVEHVFDETAASSGDVLVLRGVTKRFGGVAAVDGIDLTIPAGSFYGIVGPNGAGKTTTLSMIAGLLAPDKGSIRVGGIDAASDPRAVKRMMGVLPDRLRTFDRLTGRQLLYYYGVLRGLKPAVAESRTADLSRAFDLTDALGRMVSDYSAGMLKKVMLAGALIHSPRLLVLDEPFEAVDPVSSAVIIDILNTYVAHGGTVILSSHGMELVERMCSRVAVIVAGQVLAEGTVEEVRGELTLEQRFVELAGGLSDVEGLEWLHTFSD